MVFPAAPAPHPGPSPRRHSYQTRAPSPGTGPHLAGVATRVVGASGPILARAGRALVYLVLAVAARVARLAVAVVRVAHIHAEPSVPAQVGNIDACRGQGGWSVRPGLPSRQQTSSPQRTDARWLWGSLGQVGTRPVTLLPCGHLTGDAGHVAVEASPATVALAAVQGVGLPAPAAILAGRGVTPAHEVLRTAVGSLAHNAPTRQLPRGPCHLAGEHTCAREPLTRGGS